VTAAASTVVACPHCGARNRVPAAARGRPRCARCHDPLPWLAEAGDSAFAEVVDQATVPVLLDLWAPWCGPCRAVSPALENIARDLAGRLKLVKVNVDESPGVAGRFGVQGIPTLVVLNRGAVVSRQTGAAPEAALRQWVEGALASVDQAAGERPGS
jgi:thioredoxin 2